MLWHLSPKERAAYVAMVALVLFGVGYVGAQRLRKPAPIILESSKQRTVPVRPVDGQKVLGPGQSGGQTLQPPQVHSGKRLPAIGSVSLNASSIQELQTLPGVGPATAERIADYRRVNGRFRSIEELRRVRGIGEKKLAAMRQYLKL